MAKTRKQRTNLILTERDVVLLLAAAYLAGQRGSWPIQLWTDAERIVLSASLTAHGWSDPAIRDALSHTIAAGFMRGGKVWEAWQINPFATLFSIFGRDSTVAPAPEEKPHDRHE